MHRSIAPARLRFVVDPAATEEGTPGAPAAQPTPAPPAAPASPAPAEEDWKAKFEAQQKVNRDLETKLKAAIPKDEAETLRAELAKAQGREAEYAADQERIKAKREADAAAIAKANTRILKAEIRAVAAARLADPEDALHYLDLADFQVGEDGEVDRNAVTAAVEELVKSKPYLAAQGGAPGTVFSPTSAREGQTMAQWTDAQLAAATPEQINTARREGLLDNLLGTKH